MPISVTWFVKDHILFSTAQGKMTSDEISAVDQEAMKLLSATKAPLIHAIMDQGELEALPGIFEQNNSNQQWMRDARIGWIVIVNTPSRFAKYAASFVAQMFKKRIKFVDSMDEALTFLQSHDATLPDLRKVAFEPIQSKLVT